MLKINNFDDIKNILFNNLSIRQTIFKNTLWLALGTTFNKLLTFALMIYTARILGAEDYGKFTFAIAFISLLMVFSDLGLASIITREFVSKKEKRKEFYSIVSLKILLVLGTFVLIFLASLLFLPEKNIQGIVLTLSIFLLINGLIGSFYSFFHALQRMEYEVWLDALQVLLMVGFGFFVLFKIPSVENLSYVYSFSSLIALIFVLFFFHFKIFPLKLEWNFSVWKKFLKMSWPLALISLFGLIYGYTDSVMLGYWGMLTETGWYNAASKIAMIGILPIGFIASSFYPVLSKFSKESKERFQKAWNYELEIMIILALPFVAGGMFLAPKIIYSFYTINFAPSILTFQILTLTTGILFLYRPFYDAMIVLNQQTKTFWITIGGALVNVVLNWILIPKYTLYGAAATTVITNFLILLIIIFFAEKYTFLKPVNLKIFFTFLISLFSAFLMYLIIKQPLIYNINIFILFPMGVAIYFGFFLIIKKYIFGYFEYIYARN